MTLAEFKAWFDGYTEDMDGAPTAKQWKRIKKRVAEIDGQTLTYPVYIDRYIRPYPWLREYWHSTCSSNAAPASNSAEAFNSAQGMHVIGKAEAFADWADAA